MVQVPCRNQPQQAITSTTTNTAACITTAASTSFSLAAYVATVQIFSTQVATAFLLLFVILL
jgi:hypothetical protein